VRGWRSDRAHPLENPRFHADARTAHILGGVLPLESPAGRLRLGSTWVSHVFFPRSRETHAFFGLTEHELVLRHGDWRVAKKKILLQNDYIPTMLDVYCV